MATRTISLPDPLDQRIRALTRDELPSLSKTVTKLLEREVTRIETARARRTEKDNA